MAQLTCDCLNVKINLRDTDLNGNSADIPSDCKDCDFFQSDLTEVKISPCAVEQEHPYLVHKTAVKDWLVHRCVNCGLYTHAFPSRPGQRGILVSRALQSDPAAHQRLLRSSDYSPLFRIVLRGQDPNIPSPLPISGEESHAFESLQSCISRIQQQVNTYLLQEEANMEERIRVFEEEQRTLYSELENRVKNQKKKMISVLFNNMQSPEEESVSINGNKPALRSTKSVPMTTALEINPSQKVLMRKTDNPVPRPRSFRSYNDSPDIEGMFMLDDDDDTPFFASDEEDTDDSLQMDDSRRSSSGGNLNSVLSTSVPVSIPNWRLSRKLDLEDDEGHVPAPEEMAASMQALARSVHNNDITNIFGDLPRPRLNTFTGTTRPVRK